MRVHFSFDVGVSPTLAHYCVEKGINKQCDPSFRRRIDVRSPGRAKNGMGDIGARHTALPWEVLASPLSFASQKITTEPSPLDEGG